MRLTRLVTTDDLGLWLIRYPAYQWSNERDPDAQTWRAKLVSGLDCPFCVGTWIGYAILLGTAVTPEQTRHGRVWRFALAGLALNEVAAHLGARLGDTPADDE